jgi:hypothetical protein
MRKLFANGLILFAGMVTADAPVYNLTFVSPVVSHTDPRLEALREYFALGNCPALAYSEEFLRAADTYNLDWTLLPSIAIIETSGGKCARDYNLFGWDNGRARFPSAPRAIDHVAFALAEYEIYRSKNLDGLLTTYNPVVPNYGIRVKSVMKNIGRRVKSSRNGRFVRPVRPPAS